jgi:hypothetical protein
VARRHAEAGMPEQMAVTGGAESARAQAREAEQALRQAREQHGDLHPARLAGQSYQRYSRKDLPKLREQQQRAQHHHDGARDRIAKLVADPAVRSQPDPDGWVSAARRSWQTDYTRQRAQAREQARARAATERAERQAAYRRPSFHRSPPGRDRGGYSR